MLIFMVSPEPANPQPKVENKCPECLFMKLDSIVVKSKKKGILSVVPKTNEAEGKEIDLFLTISFNEDWQPIIGGKIKIGFKGGTLRIKLKNGRIPYELRSLIGKLELSILKERQEQENSESQRGLEASLTDNKPTAKGTTNKKEVEGKTDKFQFSAPQARTGGNEENPIWFFSCKTGEPTLIGSLVKEKLGTILRDSEKEPCELEALFEVTEKDIQLIDAQGPWLKEILPEQRKALDRAIALLFLREKLQPYLSRVEVQYG